MKIYCANIVYTPTPDSFQLIEHGYVAVSDEGYVEEVGKTLPSKYTSAQVLDYGDKLLIPSFFDMHVHAPQYRNMSLAMDEPLLPWLEKYTFPEESKYADSTYAERMYRRFVHALWLQGTTRCSVFGTIHLESTKLLADLFSEAGMGAYIGLVGMNRNCPDSLRNTEEEAVEDTISLATYLEQNPMVHAIVTPRFVPTCTPQLMRRLGQIAQEKKLPVQSHLSENQGEIAWVKELEPHVSCYGAAYDQYGLFGQTPTLMAHCCYTEGVEQELVKKNDVIVVHCPTSNVNLSSGIAPIRRFLDAGIRVMLGSDVSGGHHLSMSRVMQYAIQVSKLRHLYSQGKEHFLSLSEAFYLATKSGGSFFGKVGSFEQGYAFDALLIDDSSLDGQDYDLIHRIERYIYLGDDRHIEKRYCQGKELKEPCLK